VRQRLVAKGQRGWKAHPAGRWAGIADMPGSGSAIAVLVRIAGTLRTSALV
jgi:hypothetical protein